MDDQLEKLLDLLKQIRTDAETARGHLDQINPVRTVKAMEFGRRTLEGQSKFRAVLSRLASPAVNQLLEAEKGMYRFNLPAVFNAKLWLQDEIKRYGIDLSAWEVKLVRAPRPSNMPGHLSHSGYEIIATNPADDTVEIIVPDVWLSSDFQPVQWNPITLG